MEDLRRYDLGIWRMRPNPIKSRIKSRELTLGVEQRWFVHGIEMNIFGYLAQAGYDFVVIDTEHTPWYGLEACANAIIAAEAAGVVPFIRISGPFEPVLATKAMDIGAYGLWIPHVETKEELQKVIALSKYKIIPGWEWGERGVSHDFRADGYGAYNSPEKTREFQRFSNEETLVCAMPLESKKGIENIEEIISVKGLDMISLSTTDIAQCLGHPDEPDHPEVMKVRDRICDLCMKKGIAVYLPRGAEKPNLVKHYYEKGVRIFYAWPQVRNAYVDAIRKMHEICK